MEEQTTDKATIIIVGIIALIVGFLLGWIANGGNNEADKKSSIDTTTKSEAVVDGEEVTIGEGAEVVETIPASGGDVSVSNQAAGKTVTVASVAADGVTWVAVREEVAGKVGNVLGAKRIDGGTKTNVIVSLLRATTAGKGYYVVLFTDNGDKKFDQKTDRPVLDKDSTEVLAVKFMAN